MAEDRVTGPMEEVDAVFCETKTRILRLNAPTWPHPLVAWGTLWHVWAVQSRHETLDPPIEVWVGLMSLN